MGSFTELSVAAYVLRYILAVLAVWRMVHAFSMETGPFALFVNAREWVIRRYGYESWQSEFVRCPMCQSFWGGAVAALIGFPLISVGDTLILWAAISGGVCLLHLKTL